MKSILLKSIVVLFLIASFPSLSEARNYSQQSTIPPFLLNTLSIMFNMSAKVKLRANIIDYASKYIGTPYRSGGVKPGGFDCSGFTSYVFRNATGREIGGWTVPQESAGTKISVAEAQPGDLYFWGSAGSTYHVAIALGGGQYIHAPSPGQSVSVSSVGSWGPSFAVRM